MIAIKLWRLIVVVCVVVATQTTPSFAAPSLDPLFTASRLSNQAQNALTTSVAIAGTRLVGVGERGTILLSDDQGKTWRQVLSPVRVTLTKVTFVSPQRGWAIGYSGVVLTTRDGGETWTKQFDGIEAAKIEDAAAKASSHPSEERLRAAQYLIQDGPDKPFLDIRFVDEKNGMIVGAYGLAFATNDGGETWQSLMGQIDNPSGMHLYAIHSAPSGLYLVGEQGHIFRATNANSPFVALPKPGEGTLFGMMSTFSGELVVFGLRGHVYRSLDAGDSWDKLSMPPVNFTTGLRLQNGALVLADESGQVRYSNDRGTTFKTIQLEHPRALTDLVEITDGALIAAGVGGLGILQIHSSQGASN